ncbi:MAG: DUF4838 domain-containing protein [Eubacteriales bacterium]|nr:DUF4838 domain-containing protein [Eubacteriales bacterium]
MKKGRITKIALLACLVVTALAAFSGCGKKDEREATFLLKNRSEWSEAALREQMSAEKGGVTLLENGEVKVTVVYSEGASESLIAAADFMAATIDRMSGSSGVRTAVKKGGESGFSIYVGRAANSALIDLSDVKDDGYKLEIKPEGIYIVGKTDDATRNGIYDFLETHLECMYVSPENTYVPLCPTVKLALEEKTVNPTITWRKVYQYESVQNGWYERLKMNGTIVKEGENSIELYNEWGTWCHSSFEFVPPEKYFDEHPEYYAKFLGKRRYQFNVLGRTFPTHLCYTNEEVYQIAEAELVKRIEANPEVKFWDFSIMDTYFATCRCKECKKFNKEAGSEMGTLLAFLNRLADAIRDDYPDVYLSTLAYQRVKNPPKNMKCAPNLCINVCAFPGTQSYPYSTEGGIKASREFAERVVEWGKICDNILVWDYVVNFTHLKLPFPNFEFQKENLEFYLENNIRFVFHQGSREPMDENAEMRTYLLSRQLWDKDVDLLALAKKYVAVVYGDAAGLVEEYMDTANAAMIESGADLSLYDSPKKHKNGYLAPKLTDKYLELTEKMLEVAENSDTVNVKAVEMLRVNALYAKMTDASWDYRAKKAAFEEFKALSEKYNFTKSGEIVEMSRFVEKDYPRTLIWIVFKYVLSVLGGIAVIALIVLGVKFGPKIVRKAKNKRLSTAK